MTEQDAISLKERIVLAGVFSAAERDYLLQLVNNDTSPIIVGVHDPGNEQRRIENLWVVLSVDEGGEGLCAAPMGEVTMPLITTNERLLHRRIVPLAKEIARTFGKTMRLVQFTARKDLGVISPYDA